MRKAFLSNLAFLVVVNLLIKPFYIFGIDRTVQNTVGAEDYGLYFTLFNFAFLFQIINDFGLQNFNNQHLAKHRQLLDKYLPTFLVLKWLLALVYLAVLMLVAWLADYPRSYYHWLAVIGINWILTSLILFLRSNVSALGWYRTDSLLSVLDRTLLILVVGAILWTPILGSGFRMEWFIYAQTATLLLTVGIALAVVGRRVRRWTFRVRPILLLLVIKQSYPYALVIFLMTLYSRIDGVMIERLLADGAREAGIYAMAYRLLDAANMFGFLMAGLLLPMFARLLREKLSPAPLLQLSFRLTWAIAGGLAVVVSSFSKEIMPVLYTEGSIYSAAILSYLMVSFIAVSGTYIHGTLLTAYGRMRRMNQVFLIGVVLNVSLNFWLISEQRALGAAMATCITQFVVWLAQAELVRRTLGLPWLPLGWWRLLAYLTGLVVGCQLIRELSLWNWLVEMLLCMSLALILALALDLLPWRALLARVAAFLSTANGGNTQEH